MRIAAITPIRVGPEELARRQKRYDRLSPGGMAVTLFDLDDPAAPAALDTAEDIRRSEQLVVARARTVSPADYDAVLPDCVLDPGVGVVLDVTVPLVGILQLSTHLLAGVGRRFAAVARNDAIATELAAKARSYGLGDRLSGVTVLGLDVADIPDDSAWAAAIQDAVAGIDADTVVNGCSAVEVHPGQGADIVDPTALALQVLGLAATANLAPRSALAAR